MKQCREHDCAFYLAEFSTAAIAATIAKQWGTKHGSSVVDGPSV